MDDCRAELVHYDAQAEHKLAAALLYRFSPMPYAEVWQRVAGMDRPQLEAIVHEALERLGPHDVPLRELEVVDYTFDLVMDYGAYREFKRHRMQTYLAQPGNGCPGLRRAGRRAGGWAGAAVQGRDGDGAAWLQ